MKCMKSLALKNTRKFIRQGYYLSNTAHSDILEARILDSFLHNKLENKTNVVIGENPWFPKPSAVHFKLNSLWGALKNARKLRKEK